MKNTITYLAGAATANIAATGEITIHTVEIPITTVNTLTFQSTATPAVVYFVLPAATLPRSYKFNCVVGNGLDVVAAGADVAIITTAS